jgi:hypothetical protein
MAQLEDLYLRENVISAAGLHVRLHERDAANELLQISVAYLQVNHTAQKDQQRHIRVLVLQAQNLHQHAVGIDEWKHA